jgi:transposase
MSSLIGKRIGGRTYYYLRESARVGGRPKIVSQRYLGKASDIAAALEGVTVVPERTRHLSFGDVAAAWWVIERLGVARIIDEVTGPRRADAAASAGTYLALAALNRVVAPCSKLAFADWWASMAGSRWVKTPAGALDHRRFWDAMDCLDTEALRRVETELGRRMVAEFGLDLSGLVLDMTNFATYIDTGNEKAPIAQRGKAKQKRTDLRLVGLALVVTRDGGIPVVSHAYPGDRPDVSQFGVVIEELVTRYRQVCESVESLTVVYDAGQNSADNHGIVEQAGLGFVGSLPPSDYPGLLAVPRKDYVGVDEDRYPGVTCVDTEVSALGVTRRAVLTHSPTLHAAQSRGFDQTLAKARKRLHELAARLARGKTRRGRHAVEADIAAIVKPRWISEVLSGSPDVSVG